MKTTMRKPDRSSFDLEKVKVIKGGGLEISYEVEDMIGSEAYRDKDTKKSTKQPHPDLTQQLRLLIPMLARVYHFTFIREVINEPEFKAKPEQARFAERALQAIMEKITVTGVSVSGMDEHRGIIIMGTFNGDVLNVRMSINSHRIKFNSTTYGFKEGLEEIITKLTSEVYEYLFENKQAQLTMFDGTEQGDKEEEKE
jgi:hypothetical protein